LVFPGDFSASLRCQGLGNKVAGTFSSPTLVADCTTLSFIGGGATTSDPFGQATMGLQGTGCAPKAVSVHVAFGAVTLDVPFTLKQ
jgi:hypothetical protein